MIDPTHRPGLPGSIDPDFLKGVGIALAAGVVLAFTGAFGMTGEGFGHRLLYWLPLMLAGALWGHICARLLDRWIDSDRRPWLASLALTLAIGVPLTVVVWSYTVFLFEAGRHPSVGRLIAFFPPVLVVTGVVSLLNVFLQRKPIQTHAAPAGQPISRFPERFPPRLRGAALQAVETEDHYLRLHTDRGSDLILMRFSDALVELEGLEGAQTHRGWWVAREAVRQVERGDGRATLTLEGGVRAPVSRRYARALREAGWY